MYIHCILEVKSLLCLKMRLFVLQYQIYSPSRGKSEVSPRSSYIKMCEVYIIYVKVEVFPCVWSIDEVEVKTPINL